MSSRKYTELPLHRGTTHGKPGGALGRLNEALDKGLDMAGVGRTKVGKGDKEQAYVVKTYSFLFFLLFVGLLMFSAALIAGFYYFDLKFIKRSAYHDMYVNHISFQKSQHKLTATHLELQKTLEFLVQETERVEEFRSFLDQMFGDLSTELKSSVPSDHQEKTEGIVGKAEETTISRIDELLRDFVRKKKISKHRMNQLSVNVLEDIELSEEEFGHFSKHKALYKARKERLSSAEKARLKLSESLTSTKGFGHIDKTDAEQLETSLNNFFEQLEQLDFPVVKNHVISLWETRLEQVQAQLEDEQTATDLATFRAFIQAQLMMHAPQTRVDINLADKSLIERFEKVVLLAKLAPHKQELLDLFSGWKSGNLNAYQVLGNIERISSTEHINLTDLFN